MNDISFMLSSVNHPLRPDKILHIYNFLYIIDKNSALIRAYHLNNTKLINWGYSNAFNPIVVALRDITRDTFLFNFSLYHT